MSEQKQISVVLTSTGEMEVGERSSASGWGPDGEMVAVDGPVSEIMVKYGGSSSFSIRILPDGSLIFTSYTYHHIEAPMVRNLHIDNDRPWTEAKKEGET